MIKVLLFAGLQEKTGKSELSVKKEEMTVDELVSYLRKNEKSLNLTNIMIAVNEEVVNDPNQLIQSGDIVALLPPVSGG